MVAPFHGIHNSCLVRINKLLLDISIKRTFPAFHPLVQFGLLKLPQLTNLMSGYIRFLYPVADAVFCNAEVFGGFRNAYPIFVNIVNHHTAPSEAQRNTY